MLFAVQMTTTKVLTATNSVLTIMFWMNVMQFPLYAASHIAAGGSVWMFSGADAGETAGGVPAVHQRAGGACLPDQRLSLRRRDHGGADRLPAHSVHRLVGVVLYHERFDPMVLLGAAISAAGILWSLNEARGRRK